MVGIPDNELSGDSERTEQTVKTDLGDSQTEKQNSISCIALSHRVEQNVPARFEFVIADKKRGVLPAAGDITSTGRQTPLTTRFTRLKVSPVCLSLRVPEGTYDLYRTWR